MRTQEEIMTCLNALKKDLKTIRGNKDNYVEKEGYYNMIREHQHRIHTLEWVLGDHERFD